MSQHLVIFGRPMPPNVDMDMVGEVFVGIAGYDVSENIIFETYVYV